MNSQNNAAYLGARIRTARVAAKLSQKRLADETGIPVYRISDIEHGMNHYRYDLVKRLCNALGIEIDHGTYGLKEVERDE